MERALYRLQTEENHEIITTHSATQAHFDAAQYSRFKYGDGSVAAVYADQLIGMLEAARDITPTDALMVCGSAYHQTPTAAASIAMAFADQLTRQGRNAHYFRIHCDPYARDYGAMSIAERRAVLAGNNLRVASEVAGDLPGAKVIAIDDIRITGMHEFALAALFKHHQASTVIFCYVAVLPQEQGESDPLVEDRINHAYVTNLEQLAEIIDSNPGMFSPNARTCKFILRAPDAERRIFAHTIPHESLELLVESMVADGYHELHEYEKAFLALRGIARSRGLG
jgi:hypothetical protein